MGHNTHFVLDIISNNYKKEQTVPEIIHEQIEHRKSRGRDTTTIRNVEETVQEKLYVTIRTQNIQCGRYYT